MQIFKFVKFIFILITFSTLILGDSHIYTHRKYVLDDTIVDEPFKFPSKYASTRCSRHTSSNYIQKKEFGASDRGRCECALFSVNDLGPEAHPIVAKQTIEVQCNKEGQDTCGKLCVEIAKAAQNQGPIIVCNAAGNMKNLIMRLYSRVCETKDWRYSGIESTDELCCENGLPVKCGNQNVPSSLAITSRTNEETVV